MKVRLIDTGFNGPFTNMAIDEALLSSKLPVLRFYGWRPAGLSIGYFQGVDKINLDRCKELGIPIVRRLTGGNAVLHEHELTYSFIIGEDKMPKGVVESYKEIAKGLLLGLKKLGLDASMNSDVKNGEKSAVCFNDPSWYEILVNGKKIIGSAQKRVDGKILQHGAILLDVDVEKYCSLFKGKDLSENLKQRMTSVGNKDYGEVKKDMKKGFEEALGIKFVEDKLSEEELELAKKLESNKYSKWEWNHSR